tara:strand:- start:590 stop:1144 length:555 start_codon:yes stop_codon:yes gene_type:complete
VRNITLILGGSRSGKSSFGEQLALKGNAPPVYIFTAQALDNEMEHRIRIHQERRKDDTWQEMEAPLELAAAIEEWDTKSHVILVDCLSLWLSNVMAAERDINAEIKNIVERINNCSSELILISSEVGLGIVPENFLARSFRDYLGLLHQKIAAIADNVTMMVAGIPLIVKEKSEASENIRGDQK